MFQDFFYFYQKPKTMKIKSFAFAFILILSLACSPKIIQPEVIKSSEVSFTPIVNEGKLIYEKNCANCHGLYNPTDFNAEQWKPILLSMQKNANISHEEREKIFDYLTK